MNGPNINPRQDVFFTPAAGISRHDWHCNSRSPSRYFVVARTEVIEILDFFCADTSTQLGWNHREAVVDDFGTLVRVSS
jgi:hypothetical protein